MPVIKSQISTTSESFKANSERMKALVRDTADKSAVVEKGGTDEARQRHVNRGKLLPRDRLWKLLHPRLPFP